jgi:hypothetical protein
MDPEEDDERKIASPLECGEAISARYRIRTYDLSRVKRALWTS